MIAFLPFFLSPMAGFAGITKRLKALFNAAPSLVETGEGSLPEARLVRGPLQVVRGPVVHGPPHH